MLNPRAVMALQRGVGNAAVVYAVNGGKQQSASGPVVAVESAALADAAVQRLAIPGNVTQPPVAPTVPDPDKDPRFAAVKGAVKKTGHDLKKHPTPASEVSKAQGAAKAPPDDKAGQAKAARVGTMAAAKPKGFDKAAFIAAVKVAIAKAAPKNLDEADKFGSSGKADGVKGEVMSKVTSGKDASASDVKGNSEKPPDTAVAKEKPVTPLVESKPAAPPPVNAAAGMPAPAPAAQVNFAAGPHEVDEKMKDADVSEESLTKSNEPELQGAVIAKKTAEAHSAAAPAKIRQTETQALTQAQGQAQSGTKTAMGAMLTGKSGALGRVAASNNDTKSKDEAERARVAGDINKIFDKTKTDVDVILNGLDGKVTAEFDKGEAAARAEFTRKHQTDMEAYKDDRYSGLIGKGRWLKDKFAGLPAEANKIYDAAKALYESRMTTVISTVADLIGRELDAAKARIALGKQQIDDYVKTQPKNLQKVAAAAGKEVSGKFEQLESDVDAKQDSLVDDLANKYVESRNKVDEEIKAEQEKNKGLIDKVKDAIGGAIAVVLKLKDLFLNLLARAASAFSAILKDPIGFISNFMSAVKQGFMNFVGNIWEHLKKGLLGWLFGALAEAGIELPEKFDIKGILKLVASIMGLTWANLKNRIMKMAPWVAKVIDVVESKIEVFRILATEGVAGLWNWIKNKLGDLKEMILSPIKDFVIEKIVKAGITWVLGMLNPAGALIKIVQALIGVVQWIMERGAALMDFIGTVVDAVVDIAKGGAGGVPAKIEASLGKAVPLVISFLANLLGLGGISEKIKSILQAVQKPINQVIDGVIKGGLKLARPLIAGVKGLGAKAKAKILGGDDSPEGKQKRLDRGMAAASAAMSRFSGSTVGRAVLLPLLAAIRLRYGLTSLDLLPRGDHWAIRAVVNPIKEEDLPTIRRMEERTGQGRGIVVIERADGTSGAYTEPELPAREVAAAGGVRFSSNYRSNDHGPAHLHVRSAAGETRILRAGGPMPGDRALTAAEQEVFQDNRAAIVSALEKIGRWLQWAEMRDRLRARLK